MIFEPRFSDHQIDNIHQMGLVNGGPFSYLFVGALVLAPRLPVLGLRGGHDPLEDEGAVLLVEGEARVGHPVVVGRRGVLVVRAAKRQARVYKRNSFNFERIEQHKQFS